MSRTRSTSLPPGSNPFWSDRALLEYQVRMARPQQLPNDPVSPENLPVPDWREEDGHGARTAGLMPTTWQEAVGSLGDPESFRTPTSPEQMGVEVNAGRDPRPSNGQWLGQKSEGPMPVPSPDQVPAEDRGRSLDRAMEEVMMDHVMEENRMLKEQLKQIQKEQARHREPEARPRERERTPPPRPPMYPPPSTPPRMRIARHTPGGTQVPETPDEARVGSMLPLGIDDQQCRRTWERSSGREEPQVPSPREARMMWLEREVQSLQTLIAGQQPAQWVSSYWGQGYERQEPPKPYHGEEYERERRQGQETVRQINQRAASGRQEKEDLLRSFPVVLPKLVDPGDRHSALQAGDWIAQVRPLMADVSSQAGWWWDCIVELRLGDMSNG